MRFSIVTLLTAALASTALAAPSTIQHKSLVTDAGQIVGQLINGLDQALGVTDLESLVDGIIRGTVSIPDVLVALRVGGGDEES